MSIHLYRSSNQYAAGQAEKRQVQMMVQRILSLKEVPKPDDAADALAVAICHLHGHRLEQIYRSEL